jgi:hypothetical protein
MQFLARLVGSNEYATEAATDYQKASKAFEEKLWFEKGGFYSYAFNSSGEQVNEVTPWNAVALAWEIGSPAHATRSLEKLNSSELTTDWGIRSISEKSKYYEPLNYNYGSVWPFIGSWVAAAQYKHHFALQGYNTVMAAVHHTFDNQLGAVTEVFSGATNVWLQEAVSHQGFSSAAVVLPLVRGLLGLEGNASEKLITFAPQFPGDWDHVSVSNYQIGKATFAFDYTRQKDRIILKVQLEGADNFRLRFTPAIGVGAEILSAAVDGGSVKYEKAITSQSIQPIVLAEMKTKVVSEEIAFRPTVELLPPEIDSKTGDKNRGIKIISVKYDDKKLHVEVEGFSGYAYAIRVLNSELIAGVQGATVEGNAINIKMPEEQGGSFVHHSFDIIMK